MRVILGSISEVQHQTGEQGMLESGTGAQLTAPTSSCLRCIPGEAPRAPQQQRVPTKSCKMVPEERRRIIINSFNSQSAEIWQQGDLLLAYLSLPTPWRMMHSPPACLSHTQPPPRH